MRSHNVKVCVITGFGINADKELAQAFIQAGGQVDLCHINDLRQSPGTLLGYSILAFPGGFSFGDHVGSGKILSHLIKVQFRETLDEFITRGGLILGICNGFQTLVKMGILPNMKKDWTPEVSLIHNESGTFIDTWVDLKVNPTNTSPWLRDLGGIPVKYPIRHGEGRFITRNPEVLQTLEEKNLVAFRYKNNPNGSENDIAGITDGTGQVLGLMPHPEAYLFWEQNPKWARNKQTEQVTPGLQLLKNAVDWCISSVVY